MTSLRQRMLEDMQIRKVVAADAMKRAFSRVAAPSRRQAARDAAMREKVALNEAGWRVGIPLALNVD